VNETRASRYEIRVQGHLASHRLDCFEELVVTHHPSGETRVVGTFDPAALHGLLDHLYQLGVVLLSVQAVDGQQGK
jgi:hypothetical protein